MNPGKKNRSGGVCAVVLAAGASRRMGDENKLLANVHGRPIIRSAVTAALEAGAGPVVVVTGFEGGRVRAVLSGLDVGFADNPDYPEGLSTSLKAGIEAVPQDCTGAVIVLGDMPRVSAAIIDKLVDRFETGGGETICVPVHGGRRGNPVLWPRRFFADLAAVQGDRGGRDLLQRLSGHIETVEVDTPEIFFDVDTPDDLPKS
ncbi:MAG: nucleotidyltransferase family protein [Rhodospirillales bacterium]|nr:nucleotidyltransferase family protein [Alphaproteobacteria bacterium]MBL6948740.1 nucleotidyltransferase family protein [Rhodospirillales bacterium]